MAITSHTSGNINDIRAYPFADTANLRDRDNDIMPESIINDCHIWWPDTYGEVGYVSNVTVSGTLITLSIAARSTITNVSTPIAAVAVTRPEVAYRSYPLIAMKPGVGGWVAIGSIPGTLTDVNTWQFDTYANAELLRKLARSYPVYPTKSLGKENNESSLSGVVKFIAGANISIKEGYRFIEGMLKRCIVFGLDENQLPGLYSTFGGKCGKRPESNTCDRMSIRSINNVTPDCTGRIYITAPTIGTLYAKKDFPSGAAASHGIALLSPVEYNDVCEPVPTFAPIKDDTCLAESSSSIGAKTLTSLSSSSTPAPLSSSSAFKSVIKTYSFSSPADLRDWTLFEDDNEHIPDWDVSAITQHASDKPVIFKNDVLVIPTKAETGKFRAIYNNARLAVLSETSDEVTFNIAWNLDVKTWSDVAKHRAIDVYIKLTTDHVAPVPFTGVHGWRLKISYTRHQFETIRTEVSLEMFTNFSGWVQIGTTTTFNRLFSSCAVWDSSSSVGRSSAPAVTSSSSANCYKLREDTTFKIKLVNDDGGGSPSKYIYDYYWDVSGHTNSGTHEELTGSTLVPSQFFGIKIDHTNIGGPPVSFNPINLELDRFDIVASKLETQKCTEEDFKRETSDHILVPYKVKYGPPWSNDFGTSRAVNQFQLLPEDSAQVPVPQSPVVNNHVITYGKQYLDLPGVEHKYAILDCLNGIANTLTISAAFKYVSGSPICGLVIGYQPPNAILQDRFWAVVMQMTTKKVGYGVHARNHNFSFNSMVDIPDTDSDWLYQWHRLVVRVTLGTRYTVAAWVDPASYESSSAIMGRLTKTIEIDEANPTAVFSGLSVYTPGSNPSSGQFLDGKTGIYAFVGEARAAEFTVSSSGSDIVIDNKVPWLFV